MALLAEVRKGCCNLSIFYITNQVWILVCFFASFVWKLGPHKTTWKTNMTMFALGQKPVHCFGLPRKMAQNPGVETKNPAVQLSRRHRRWPGMVEEQGRISMSGHQHSQTTSHHPQGPLPAILLSDFFFVQSRYPARVSYPSKQPGKPFSLLKTAQNVQLAWVGSLVTRKCLFFSSRCSQTCKLNWMVEMFYKHRHVFSPKVFKTPTWFFEIQMSPGFFFKNWLLSFFLCALGNTRIF